MDYKKIMPLILILIACSVAFVWHQNSVFGTQVVTEVPIKEATDEELENQIALLESIGSGLDSEFTRFYSGIYISGVDTLDNGKVLPVLLMSIRDNHTGTTYRPSSLPYGDFTWEPQIDLYADGYSYIKATWTSGQTQMFCFSGHWRYMKKSDDIPGNAMLIPAEYNGEPIMQRIGFKLSE